MKLTGNNKSIWTALSIVENVERSVLSKDMVYWEKYIGEKLLNCAYHLRCIRFRLDKRNRNSTESCRIDIKVNMYCCMLLVWHLFSKTTYIYNYMSPYLVPFFIDRRTPVGMVKTIRPSKINGTVLFLVIVFCVSRFASCFTNLCTLLSHLLVATFLIPRSHTHYTSRGRARRWGISTNLAIRRHREWNACLKVASRLFSWRQKMDCCKKWDSALSRKHRTFSPLLFQHANQQAEMHQLYFKAFVMAITMGQSLAVFAAIFSVFQTARGRAQNVSGALLWKKKGKMNVFVVLLEKKKQ